MSFSDIQSLLSDLVRDPAGYLDSSARGRALAVAVLQYGKDRPRLLVADLMVDEYGMLGLPPDWDAIDCRVLAVETPIGAVPPVLLTADSFVVVKTTDGPRIALAQPPTAGTLIRVTCAMPHQLDAETDTIPAADREAVAAYAAAILHDQLASAASGDRDGTILADSVNHGSRAGEYANRAQALRQRYHDLLGIDPKRVKAASVLIQHRRPSQTTGHRLLGRQTP